MRAEYGSAYVGRLPEYKSASREYGRRAAPCSHVFNHPAPAGRLWRGEDMALVQCRECGSELSDQAKLCPNCGIARLVKQTVHPLLTIALVLLAVGFIMSRGTSAPETNSIANDVSAMPEENAVIAIDADSDEQNSAYGKAYQKKIPDPVVLYSKYDQLPLDRNFEQEMSIIRLWVLFRIGAIYGNCDLIDKNVGASLSKKHQEFRRNRVYNSILANKKLSKEKAEYAANMIVGYDPVYGYNHCAIAIISYLKPITEFANSKSFSNDIGRYFSDEDISPVAGSSMSVDEWRTIPTVLSRSGPSLTPDDAGEGRAAPPAENRLQPRGID